LILRIGVGCWIMARVLRSAKPSSESAPVPVFTAEVSVPLITGLFRPVILLPQAAESWPSLQRSAAVKHELTHLERKDLWTSLAAHLACAVYWFHPLAWVLASRLRDEQETACDDAVIHSGFEPTTYAEALVAAARQVTTTPMIGCPMITRTNEPSLKSRIARLLDRSTPRASSPATLRRAAILFGITLVAIVMLNAGPQAPGHKGTAADEHVYKMGEGITAPSVLYKVEPEYTDEARDAKIAGTVLLSATVGTDGIAHDIDVVRGPGAGLEAKAVEAVEQWRFKPGELKGEPVAVRAQIEINFRLK
jgi:TonB family protein